MNIAARGPTLAEAGVILAKPATGSVKMPIRPGLPFFRHSRAIQVSPPIAAEIWVTSIVNPAASLAPPWLLPLKPNQPTQSIPAPTITRFGLCGGFIWAG